MQAFQPVSNKILKIKGRMMVSLSRLRFTTMACVLGLMIGVSLSGKAFAQNVLASVDGVAVTSAEVSQRSAIVKGITRKVLPQKQIINELIEERIKLKEAERIGVLASDEEVQQTYAGFAASNKMKLPQMEQALRSMGASPETLMSKFKADLSWGRVVRAKAASQPQNEGAPEAKGSAQATEYLLQTVVFIVPKGSSEGQAGQRRREAEALRGRFQGCAKGIPMATALKDVAVRPAAVRSSVSLPEVTLEALEKTAEGRLTPPDRSELGFEMIAVCEKRAVADDGVFASRSSRGRSTIKPEILEAVSKSYLTELRGKAQIVTY
jgi:peptidyl-prolyl cis-trans isomerase SurA